ncbi:uncharacterized protein LOC135835385 [Planococcus citri]|uniref:uncharacterized protein LOC135835385 n=1 Tax=Planococcus citri TaxID=170843 RepID=UPI0031FA0BEA
MKFTSILVVYIWYFLTGIVISVPDSGEITGQLCGCPHEHTFRLEPSYKHSNKPRHSNLLPSGRSSYRNDEMSPEEREERMNRGFARMMQFMTFLGHVDNYLTDKASGLIKIMGKAVETEDEEEPQEDPYYGRISRRQTPPKITATITT